MAQYISHFGNTPPYGHHFKEKSSHTVKLFMIHFSMDLSSFTAFKLRSCSLSLPDAMCLQFMIDEVMLSLAFLATNITAMPLVLRCLNMNVDDMLTQVTGWAVNPSTERARGADRRGGGAYYSRPCNDRERHINNKLNPTIHTQKYNAKGKFRSNATPDLKLHHIKSCIGKIIILSSPSCSAQKKYQHELIAN